MRLGASRLSAVARGPALKTYTRGFAHSKTVEHTPVKGNKQDDYFDFTAENYERVATILAKYPANYKQSACIPLLDLAQRQNNNFLPVAAMNKVAEILGANPMRVYEVATFYTMFNRQPVGKYFIQLCGTTPCMACGAGEIKQTITDHLGIKNGETTKDGKFTLLEVECLGACINAPMVQINDDFYEMLTKETTIELLEACAKDQPPPMTKWGSLPMNGQLSCEGPLGKTSLKESWPGIEKFMRKDLEKKVDPASIKEAMHYE
ncbi:NADH dehydrogenase ubiquinone flavoprotein 2, mitochondrial [Hondaea fermentalgiana]|uniref:NADH dehydrogenase ubiquinone flavoprotein 2, mitochondrial n=1 Tax=Hondaea fermentalgiana TaxID=2315210 RepID=A0A2R5GB44_9STRA|nr:NADH dehydrogenase ubiquinone flavoprotein 2, mitochondrial [Hondaea fermentalgiana]|eukprot:GBG28217.1 NADH dehydrogenase ubiquinone flavoprotein 2, mitochondrial [Hondaea fermentalgiana]